MKKKIKTERQKKKKKVNNKIKRFAILPEAN